MGRHTSSTTKTSVKAGFINTYTVSLLVLLVLLILGVIFGVSLFTDQDAQIMAPGPTSAPFGEKTIG